MSNWENAVGLVESKVRRATGSRVSVYETEAAGLDPDAGPYVTVCEDHGTILGHRNLTVARHHAVRPDGWCDQCGGIREENEDVARQLLGEYYDS